MLLLIVDDDQGIAFLIAEAIEAPGRRIEIVYCGEDAIEFIQKHKPDLVILDYSLPDMNARELITFLDEQKFNIPPFIVSTGQGDEIIAVEMMKMGAHDYLIKDTSLMRRIPGVVKRAIDDINKERELHEALEARRISDQKLLEEQSRLAGIIKATNVGTWEWNIKTGETLFNEQYANIMGFTLDELQPTTSTTWIKITHPDDLPLTNERLIEHFNKKADYFEAEIRVKHKAGYWMWILSRGCVVEFDDNGEPVLMSGTMQNISDKKMKEELQKEVDIAHKTLQFKQNFLASMSHEIRTPLTGIIGMIDFLKKTPLTPDQEDFLQNLASASETLRYIIDQVLDYADIEAGRMKLVYSPFDLSRLTGYAMEVFNNSCNKPLQFKSSVSKDLPGRVIADYKRITQVLGNLVSNAVKNSKDGVILVNIENEQIIAKSEMLIRVEIADTGKGINQEKKEIIFSPFTDIDQINTAYYEGTGLGLALCKEIVELHGGNIGFRSNIRGSVFWFTFRARICQEEQHAHTDSISISGDQKLRILFAEDKAITQKVVKLQLCELGHQVMVVSNGKEAVDEFHPGKYDLILMDIQMPVMDGISATQELKGQYERICPVIGLSANAFEGDRDKYMSLGFDDFINKPLNKEHFNMVVSRLFGGMSTMICS